MSRKALKSTMYSVSFRAFMPEDILIKKYSRNINEILTVLAKELHFLV